MKRLFASLATAALIGGMATPFAAADLRDPVDGFRVNPYLQAPTSTSMRLVWISETDVRGTVTVTGPGLPAEGLKLTSDPEYMPIMEYSQSEIDQEISGLEQGSWLKSNSNYRHVIDIDGLTPNSTYRYTAIQGGETFQASFTTAPTAEEWDEIRIAAFSDTETEPFGRIEHREWEQSFTNRYTEGSLERPGEGSTWAEKFGSTTRYGEFTLRYPLSQDEALKQNMNIIAGSNPDLMMVTGDLTQGSGYQPAWDEFWGYMAGENGSLASEVPFLTALGNWETYAASSGGYGSAEDRTPVVRSRNRYLEYIQQDGDPQNPQAKSSYYRVDHGPLTILTLDSTKGYPDELTSTTTREPIQLNDSNITDATLPTDTQGSFLYDEYVDAYKKLYPGATDADVDLQPFNEGLRQYEWVQEQLADAREKGQLILVQFHHQAYSIGVHGVPQNGVELESGQVVRDNQSGTAMRLYSPMFEEYGVSAVISGHDEMFERSWVDEDGDGKGFHTWDVGVAADGLRGELMTTNADGEVVPVGFNTHTQWSAIRNAPETWAEDDNGVLQLVDGGLHYGHLLIDIVKNGDQAEFTMTPVYLFPILDSDYNLVRVERRTYDDVVTFSVDLPAAETEPEPSPDPSDTPSPDPTETPSPDPTETPSPDPTDTPSPDPTDTPSPDPTDTPSPNPTDTPREQPSQDPSPAPSAPNVTRPVAVVTRPGLPHTGN